MKEDVDFFFFLLCKSVTPKKKNWQQLKTRVETNFFYNSSYILEQVNHCKKLGEYLECQGCSKMSFQAGSLFFEEQKV